jgi:hypothetical protein
MERLEVSDTAAGNVMWSTDFGDHWATPETVKHRVPMWFSNSTPRHMLERTENIVSTGLLVIAKKWKQPVLLN